MKVYAVPEGIPAPEFDWKNIKAYEAACDQHMNRLREYFREHGYTGELSGEVFRMPMADGYAQYLFINSKRGSKVSFESAFLIHLPYWDGYDSRDAEYIPKTEIMKRIRQSREIKKLFRGVG